MKLTNKNRRGQSKGSQVIIKLYDSIYLGKQQREVPRFMALTFPENTAQVVLTSKRYKYKQATIEKL